MLLTACGSSSGSHHAAEPATAPPPSAAPAGVIRTVGDLPQGIVYDPVTKVVAVAVQHPDRLLLLDPQTLVTRSSVPLPGTVRHLQLAGPGGPVLVPVESARRLVVVTLPDGVATSYPVGKQPHDAARVGDAFVVGNEFGESLTVIRDNRVARTLHGVTQPGGVVGGDGPLAAVIDVNGYTLSTYDIATGRRLAVVAAGKGPTHGVPLSGGRVAVADTRGNQLLVFTLRPLRQVARLSLPGTPYGMTVDPTKDRVWVTLTARNEVVGVDAHGATLRRLASVATVRQPDTVAVVPGSGVLFVTGTSVGQVQRTGG